MTTPLRGTAATNDVAAKVRSKAAERRISIRALALKVGMEYSAVLRRTRGEVAFSVAELIAIAIALDVEVSALMPDRAPVTEAVAS